MASLLDIGFLDNFSSIFVLLFVLVAIYAVLQTRKVLGDNPAIHFTIAFAIAMIFIFNQGAINSLKFIVPWLMMLAIAFLLLLLAVSVFVGGDVFAFMKGDRMGTWYQWMFIIGIVIIMLGISNSVGQDVGPFLEGENQSFTAISSQYRGSGDVATGNFQQNLGATIFHPKVLGVILVFFVLAMAAYYITRM